MKIVNLNIDKSFKSPLVTTDTPVTTIDLNPAGGSSVANPSGLVTADPSIASQVIRPQDPYNAIGSFQLNAVTSSIDLNITPENIVSGVDILGVEGTAESFNQYSFSAIGYDSDESFEAYAAYLVKYKSEDGLAEALYDASVAYAAVQNPSDLSPEQFISVADSMSELVFMPRINIGAAYHNQDTWSVSPYQGRFQNHKACYYPTINIAAPAQGTSCAQMFKGNNEVYYMHAVSFIASHVGAALVDCTEMFMDAHNLREIHVKGGRGSLFNNQNVSNAQWMFGVTNNQSIMMLMPDSVLWDCATSCEGAFGAYDGFSSQAKMTKSFSLQAPLCTNFRCCFRGREYEPDDVEGKTLTVSSSSSVQTVELMFRQTRMPNIVLNMTMASEANASEICSMCTCESFTHSTGFQNAANFSESFTYATVNEGTIQRSNGQGLILSNADNTNNMFRNASGITTMLGLEALTISVDLRDLSALSLDSAEAILNLLGTASEGATLTFNSAVYAQIPESYIQSATAKGWTVASA